MKAQDPSQAPVALVTGAAHRIGAQIVKTLHESGFRVIVHAANSIAQAQELADALNALRKGSAVAMQAGFTREYDFQSFADKAVAQFGRLDVLVNNASSFYPTSMNEATLDHWDDLIGSNALAPLLLSQACFSALKNSSGSIINISDIHAQRPMPQHTMYCMAKAAQDMCTKSLALEFAPHVRVNAVAPGAILWPDNDPSEAAKQGTLEKIPMAALGGAQVIADAVRWLAVEAEYVTGQILPVDGGRTLNV